MSRPKENKKKDSVIQMLDQIIYRYRISSFYCLKEIMQINKDLNYLIHYGAIIESTGPIFLIL